MKNKRILKSDWTDTVSIFVRGHWQCWSVSFYGCEEETFAYKSPSMYDENSNKYWPYRNAISAESSALMLRLLIFRSARLTYFLSYFFPFLICTQHSAEVWVPHLCVFGADCSQRDMNNEVSPCFTGFSWGLIHLITCIIAVDSFVPFSLEKASLKMSY